MIVGRAHLESLLLRLKSFMSVTSLVLSLGTVQGWTRLGLGLGVRVTGTARIAPISMTLIHKWDDG